MRAAVQHRFGGPDAVEVVEVEDPRPGPREVVVAVRAAALNRLDVLQREGPALIPGFALPHVAGMDVAGEVVEVGDEVDSVGVGARVLVDPAIRCGTCEACTRGDDALCGATLVVGGNRPGGFAEKVVVPAAALHPVPEGVDLVHAAAVPTAYSTAWKAVVVTARPRLGEWIMIHAAGSGVSTAAIQLAKRAGCFVLATAGSEAKLDVAKRLGADHVVNNRTGDVVAAAKEATGGRGVDIVFDHVGPALFQASLLALRPRGRLVFCGSTTGTEATFSLPHAYQSGMQLLGAGGYGRADFADMLAYVWRAGLEPVIDSVHPLDDIAGAQRRMERGDAIGKVVVTP